MEKDECIKAYVEYRKPKFKAENKKKDKEEKDNITNWRSKLQEKLQEIARLIDKGQKCLARNIDAKQYHGGHVYARGGNSSMALNLHNIHRQSAHSNHFQNDDGLLREGLEREYGSDYMTFVSELRRTPALKYTNNDYQLFYKNACHICNSLKKLDYEYSKDNRIAMRSTINERLGIYEKEYCIFNFY
jgi:hypothetical protein